ncbi:MAG: hypothetical protein KDE69_15815 [Burkholderiaceae bacterium]|nr:hypothetical protein [Burkholderiaceae bacterium]
MIRKTLKLLNSQETVTLLTLNLGAPVAWGPWLADIRRSPRDGIPAPHLHGLQLRPYARNGNVTLYRPCDVKDFIDAVRAADPGIKAASKPKLYVVDDHRELLPWQWRKARPVITPIKPATLLKRAA